MLLAVDPSLTRAGMALFCDGELIAVDSIKGHKGPIGCRCLQIAGYIDDWTHGQGWGREAKSLTFEWPQIYTGPKSKGDPNKLIPLAGIGMALAGVLGERLIELKTPTPAEVWGQVRKATKASEALTSPRAKRIQSRLTTGELATCNWFSLNHDEIDAIGLGLWSLGRFEPSRVFPGAT